MMPPRAKDALFCFATRGFNFATRKTNLNTPENNIHKVTGLFVCLI